MTAMDAILSPSTLAIVALTLLLLYLAKSFVKFSQYNLPPGPMPWPLIGNAWGLIGQQNLHQYFLKLSKNYGPIFRIKIGNVPHVVVNSAELALEIYVKKMTEFVDRPVQFSVAKLSEGGRDLITQNYNPFLRMHRKIVTQAIRGHVTVGEVIEDCTHEQCEAAMEFMKEKAKTKEAFSPRQLVVKTVYKIYFKLIMDLDIDFNDPDLWYLSSRSKELAQLMGIGFLADLAPAIFEWLPEFGDMKKALECRETFKDYIREKVRETEKTLDDDIWKGACAQILRAKRDAAVKEPDFDFTEEDVVLTIVEMFIGGADSIANILEWLLLEFANNPDKQEKMFKEIEEVLGDRPVSLKDRANMLYSDCCVLEALRTGLTAPINVRGSVVADTTLGGYDIPQNTPILINHYALHVDGEFWEDVDQFEPERFIQDGAKAPKPRNFIPFAAGTRSCVGEHLTKDNLFLLAVAFVQKFKFCKPEGVEKLKSDYKGGFIVVNTLFDLVVEERK